MTTKNVSTEQLNKAGLFRATLPQKDHGENIEVFIRASNVSAVTLVPEELRSADGTGMKTALAFIGEDSLTYVEEEIDEVVRRMIEATA